MGVGLAVDHQQSLQHPSGRWRLRRSAGWPGGIDGRWPVHHGLAREHARFGRGPADVPSDHLVRRASLRENEPLVVAGIGLHGDGELEELEWARRRHLNRCPASQSRATNASADGCVHRACQRLPRRCSADAQNGTFRAGRPATRVAVERYAPGDRRDHDDCQARSRRPRRHLGFPAARRAQGTGSCRWRRACKARAIALRPGRARARHVPVPCE